MSNKPVRRNLHTGVSWHWNANGQFRNNFVVWWSPAENTWGPTHTHWGSTLKLGPLYIGRNWRSHDHEARRAHRDEGG